MSKEISYDPMTKRAARAGFWRFALLGIGLAALCGCGSEPVWKSQSFAFALPAGPPDAGKTTNVFALRRVTISPLFQGRSFTYRTAEDAYEHDPYAGFFIPPERAIAQPICAALCAGGVCGCVIDLGSGLKPSLVAEVAVNELYGDFRKPAKPTGVLQIHFILYKDNQDGPGRVVMDKVFSRETPMAKAAPAALMAAWDTDLRGIMAEINAELKRATLN
jgi:hypothetical protein